MQTCSSFEVNMCVAADIQMEATTGTGFKCPVGIEGRGGGGGHRYVVCVKRSYVIKVTSGQ